MYTGLSVYVAPEKVVQFYETEKAALERKQIVCFETGDGLEVALTSENNMPVILIYDSGKSVAEIRVTVDTLEDKMSDIFDDIAFGDNMLDYITVDEEEERYDELIDATRQYMDVVFKGVTDKPTPEAFLDEVLLLLNECDYDLVLPQSIV